MKPVSIHIIRYLLCLFFSVASLNCFTQVTLIPFGSSWKYWANTQANFQAGWETVAYNDVAWPSGNGELGYGDTDENTCIPSGGAGTLCAPTGNKWPAYYFRKVVNIPDPSVYSGFTFSIDRDDGFVLYVNGTEVGRNNIAAGAVSYGTSATAAVEDAVITVTVAGSAFVAGSNTIAVEMHQATVSGSPPVSSSSDISFNLQLQGNDAVSASLLRGAYLQSGSTDGITIRWRTSTAQNSRVELGTTYGTYPLVVSDAGSVTEHIVRVNGLATDTKYYYRIGNSVNMQLPDASRFFTTLPAPDTKRKIRVIAFGDCGRGNIPYQDDNLANYQDFLTSNGIDAADAWLLLGDNAYNSGTDAEFTSNFFDIYRDNILKNHKLYPAPGNHDYGNNTGNKALRNMAYHTSFTVPQNGEAGGVASNKQNFYSFDIGNIHFLSLDSYGTESDGSSIETAGGSALKTWLTNDMAANTKKWTIAYWHHPPYTKGSHNSDAESDLVNIRQNFISFLETRGVDMIVCGHSHDYERGYLVKGYTGNWASFNPATHAVSTSSATYTSGSTCPYVYKSSPANHGTVYVVSGSAGASGTMNTGFGTSPMPFAVDDGGLFWFEVEDNRLDAKMLRRNGTVFDQFTIIKDVNNSSTYTVANGASLTLTASWPGNYNWSTSANTRSVTITAPPDATTVYSVTDTYGCITDQFSVTTSGLLPLRLQSFEVKNIMGKAQLDWQAEMSDPVHYFTIERSANGRDYQWLATVDNPYPSAGLYSFSYTDEHPLTGTAYYRLSVTGADGRRESAGVRKLDPLSENLFEATSLETIPGKLVLQLISPAEERMQLGIYRSDGKKIRTETFTVTRGRSLREFDLPAGIYIWEIHNSRGMTIQQKQIVR